MTIMELFGKERIDKAKEMGMTNLEIQAMATGMYLVYFDSKIKSIKERMSQLPQQRREELNGMLRRQSKLACAMATETGVEHEIMQDAYKELIEQIRKLERQINPPKFKNKLDVESAKLSPIGDFLPDNTRSFDSTERATYKCPFHNEKTGSMVWYKKNNTFFCFGCSAGGDSIEFIMQYYKMSFVEAVKKLTS